MGVQKPNQPVPRLLAGLLAAAVLAGCGSGTALGLTSPPPGFDPQSPKVIAQDIAFDRETLEVPAGEAFFLIFENRENVAHNVSIFEDAALQKRRFEGVIFNGPGTRWYPVPALAPGTYVFVCEVHPNMRGLLEAR